MAQTVHLLIKWPDGTEAPMNMSTGMQLRFPVAMEDDDGKIVDATLEVHLVAITTDKAGSN